MAIPTPVEYVDYLISEVLPKGIAHAPGLFKPQVEVCPFCLLDYDVVGRMESFKEDSEYVMEELRIKDRLQFKIHVNR